MGRGRCKRSCIACLAPFQTQQDSGWWRLLHVGVALKIEEMRGVLREMMGDEDESMTSSWMPLLSQLLLVVISAAPGMGMSDDTP